MNLSDPITPHSIQQRKQEILAKFHSSAEANKMGTAELQSLHTQVSKRQSELLRLVSATQREISKYFQTFQPLSCNPATFADLRLFGGPRIALNQGKLYIGTIVDGKRHGKGLIISQKGKIYEGELLLNERNGVGVEIYENSNFYVGGFSASRREGTGKMVWAIHSTPVTNFQYYVGSWKDGEPHGHGLHSTETWTFVGSFKQGMRCGKGIQIRLGMVFQGSFSQNARDGKGMVIEQGVEYYEGEFKAGRKHGYGRWKCLRTGEDYQGFFQDNRKEGIGVSLKEGILYRGLFTEDRPNGTGEYTQQGRTPKEDGRAVTQLQVKPKKQRPRGELLSAQFVRSNPAPSLQTQHSTKSMQKIVMPPRMAKLNTSRDKEEKNSKEKEKNSKEKSKEKEKTLQRRFSLASAKVVRALDNPQKHACTYKHCSCQQWEQNSTEKLKIDEKRILRLFSARKTLLKSIV